MHLADLLHRQQDIGKLFSLRVNAKQCLKSCQEKYYVVHILNTTDIFVSAGPHFSKLWALIGVAILKYRSAVRILGTTHIYIVVRCASLLVFRPLSPYNILASIILHVYVAHRTRINHKSTMYFAACMYIIVVYIII